MRSPVTVRFVLVCAALALGGSARAAPPSAADKATARSLMTEGYAALKGGDARTALARFQAADVLVHAPTTALAVAQAQEKLGQLVEAEQTATRVLNMAAHDDDPPPFRKAREDASAMLRDIDPRVPSIRIVVRGAPADQTPQVTVDDEQIPPAALAAPRKLDPGVHAVVTSVGDWIHRVDVPLKERDSIEVDFDVPPSAGGAEPAASASASASAATASATAIASGPPTEEQPPSTAPSQGGRSLMWAGFGVGVLGVAVGATAGAIALSDKSSALGKGCVQNVCPPAAHGDLHSAGTWADVSTVAFTVAGVGAAVGLAALIFAPSKAASSGSAAWVAPAIGAGEIGLRGGF